MKKISTCLLIVAAICFCKPNLLNAQVNVQDSLALVTLYDSTEGQNWKNKHNWLTNAPVSTWAGITVTENRVSKIILDVNRLTGKIPSSLSTLSELTVLSLYGNYLRNRIPSSLGNLTKLTFLDLEENALSNKIPYSFGNLINLKYLNLSYNHFSGAIPSSLANLINLQTLDLSINKLTGSIPFSLGNLINLQTLDLSFNPISGTIPSSLGNLINLTSLTLTYTFLSGNIPSSLGNLIHLSGVLLNNNKLTGSIPRSLGKLINLTVIFLNDNQLTGSIPSELGNLSKLGIVFLEDNQLTGNIPWSFGKPKFRQLYLDHNQLTGRIIEFTNSIGAGYSPDINLADNKFTFAGMIDAIRTFNHPEYSPQANILIHQSGNNLSVYTGGSYQLTLDTFKWFKNGNLVATITGDSSFIPTSSGAYNVVVTNSIATQLTLYSDTVNYITGDNLIASQINNKNLSVSVYPNPAKTFTTLSFNADGKYTITVADVSGKILQTKTGIAIKGSNIVQLNVSKYANGMYLITIMDAKNKKQTVRLNKE